MDKTLRLLIIEDSQRDVALEVRALEAAGYQVTHTVAETAAEMKKALAGQTFDIVISDHDLPQFDAPAALAVFKQSGLDIPFIIVSGALGEEKAVALMKAGAHDYVMKDKLSRLAPAVEHALMDAENRRGLQRTEERLEKSEERYRTLVEQAFEGIIVIQDGKIVFANPRAYQMIDFPRDQTEPRPFMDFIHAEDREKVIGRHLRRLKGEKFEETYPIRLVDRNGIIKWALISAILIEWEGKPATLTFLTDITEGKLADEKIRALLEESQWLLKSMINAFVIFESVFDENGTFVSYRFKYINQGYENITGVKLEDVREKTVYEVWPETESSWIENYGAVAVSGISRTFDMYHKPTDKTYHCTVYRPWDTTDRFCVIFENISDRLRAQEALRKSEARYRLLAEHTTDTIRLLDMTLKTTYLSPSAEKLRGFTYEEILELPMDKQLAPESFIAALGIFSEEIPRVESDPDYNPIHILDLEYICKDGTTVWAESKFSVVRDENGKPVSILAEARDITERRLIEKKLLKSHESLKKALHDAIDTIAKIVEVRDPYTAGHQQKVAGLATAIAHEMKLEDTRIDNLRMAAVIHDIGKMYIPSDILSRPGKLTDMEFALIKTHAQGGYDVVKGMDFPVTVAQAILQHHERLDGSGYPNQLKGEDILLEAKILAVADVVEAMASHRPYRPALGIDKALDEISSNRGRLYDPDVVDACLELFNSGRFEFKAV